MKKWLKRIVLVLAALVLLYIAIQRLTPAQVKQLRWLEKQLEVDLPRGAAVEFYEDTHGGFHGDGTLTAVVTFPTPQVAQDFAAGLETPWDELPLVPEEIDIWQAAHQLWEELPQVERGMWYYRDRFFEMYGKPAPNHYVLWNATFALLDTENGALYVLKNDI